MEDRNVLRRMERHRRSQEIQPEETPYDTQIPLFSQPFKRVRVDALASRIQRMLGDYEDGSMVDPCPTVPLVVEGPPRALLNVTSEGWGRLPVLLKPVDPLSPLPSSDSAGDGSPEGRRGPPLSLKRPVAQKPTAYVRPMDGPDLPRPLQDLKERSPAQQPLQDLKERSPAQQPLPDLKESSQPPQPLLELKENSQASQLLPDLKESGQALQPLQNLKESSRASQLLPDLKESSQALQLLPDLKESSQALQPLQDLKESSRASQLLHDLKESSQALQDLKESSQAPLLLLDLKERTPVLQLLQDGQVLRDLKQDSQKDEKLKVENASTILQEMSAWLSPLSSLHSPSPKSRTVSSPEASPKASTQKTHPLADSVQQSPSSCSSSEDSSDSDSGQSCSPEQPPSPETTQVQSPWSQCDVTEPSSYDIPGAQLGTCSPPDSWQMKPSERQYSPGQTNIIGTYDLALKLPQIKHPDLRHRDLKYSDSKRFDLNNSDDNSNTFSDSKAKHSDSKLSDMEHSDIKQSYLKREQVDLQIKHSNIMHHDSQFSDLKHAEAKHNDMKCLDSQVKHSGIEHSEFQLSDLTLKGTEPKMKHCNLIVESSDSIISDKEHSDSESKVNHVHLKYKNSDMECFDFEHTDLQSKVIDSKMKRSNLSVNYSDIEHSDSESSNVPNMDPSHMELKMKPIKSKDEHNDSKCYKKKHSDVKKVHMQYDNTEFKVKRADSSLKHYNSKSKHLDSNNQRMENSASKVTHSDSKCSDLDQSDTEHHVLKLKFSKTGPNHSNTKKKHSKLSDCDKLNVKQSDSNYNNTKHCISKVTHSDSKIFEMKLSETKDPALKLKLSNPKHAESKHTKLSDLKMTQLDMEHIDLKMNQSHSKWKHADMKHSDLKATQKCEHSDPESSHIKVKHPHSKHSVKPTNPKVKDVELSKQKWVESKMKGSKHSDTRPSPLIVRIQLKLLSRTPAEHRTDPEPVQSSLSSPHRRTEQTNEKPSKKRQKLDKEGRPSLLSQLAKRDTMKEKKRKAEDHRKEKSNAEDYWKEKKGKAEDHGKEKKRKAKHQRKEKKRKAEDQGKEKKRKAEDHGKEKKKYEDYEKEKKRNAEEHGKVKNRIAEESKKEKKRKSEDHEIKKRNTEDHGKEKRRKAGESRLEKTFGKKTCKNVKEVEKQNPFAESAGSLMPPEQRGSGENHLSEAKRLKHKADAMPDRSLKALLYLESALAFVESGVAMESEPESQTHRSAFTIFSETLELLKFILRLKDYTDASATPQDRDFLILCLRVQALLQMFMFQSQRESALRYSETLIQHFRDSSRAPSSSTDSSSRVVPQSVQQMTLSYLSITALFLKAQESWEQAEGFTDSCSGLVRELDSALGSLSLSSSITSLIKFTRLGLQRLRQKTLSHAH